MILSCAQGYKTREEAEEMMGRLQAIIPGWELVVVKLGTRKNVLDLFAGHSENEWEATVAPLLGTDLPLRDALRELVDTGLLALQAHRYLEARAQGRSHEAALRAALRRARGLKRRLGL